MIDNTALDKDIASTKIIPKDHGPCLTMDGLDVDASVAAFTLGSDICVSVERLMVIPAEAESAQLQALITHEFSHHFGFDEPHAQKIQHYYLEEIWTHKAMNRVSIRKFYDAAINYLAGFESKPATCADMDKLAKVGSSSMVEDIEMTEISRDQEITVLLQAQQDFADQEVTPLMADIKTYAANVCAGTPDPQLTPTSLVTRLKAVEHDAIFKLYKMRF